MRQLKAFGQVFLSNEGILRKIAKNVLEVPARVIIEIGPGDGRLTRHLVLKGKNLYCLEVDRRFCRMLKEEFAFCGKVNIVEQDILKFSFDRFKDKVVVCGNIPYHISSKLLTHLTNSRDSIEKSLLTVQREFAYKISAPAQTSDYSYFSCYIQYYAGVEIIFEISAENFLPRPNVDSAFVAVDYSRPFFPRADDERLLFALIRGAFNQKRKKIVNSLKTYGVDTHILRKAAILPSARAQDVSLAQYVNLSDLISLNSNSIA
jgi:16S rRNA (adenine1518-N6/adenine1519-N6)-dimethyltransferase